MTEPPFGPVTSAPARKELRMEVEFLTTECLLLAKKTTGSYLEISWAQDRSHDQSTQVPFFAHRLDGIYDTDRT